MKTGHLLLFVLIAVFCSCSSAYRTTQTPDDVYYSPAPPPPVEYVTTENQQDKDTYANHNADISEDLAIRRGINDRRYRNNISLDFGYGYSPYDYGSSFYSPYSSFYSPYSSYYNPYTYTGATFYPHNYNYYGYNSPFTNYYYSPFSNYYYPPVYVSTPVSNYRGPRTYNLGVYNNNTPANRVNSHPGQPAGATTSVPVAPVRTFRTQPSNNRSGVGNLIRRVFTPSNNNRSYSNDNDNGRSYRNDNSSNNNSSPARTNGSGSSGSSSSSSGSSSAPVRTFR